MNCVAATADLYLYRTVGYIYHTAGHDWCATQSELKLFTFLFVIFLNEWMTKTVAQVYYILLRSSWKKREEKNNNNSIALYVAKEKEARENKLTWAHNSSLCCCITHYFLYSFLFTFIHSFVSWPLLLLKNGGRKKNWRTREKEKKKNCFSTLSA